MAGDPRRDVDDEDPGADRHRGGETTGMAAGNRWPLVHRVRAYDPLMPARPSILALREFRALIGARSTNALATSALATVVAFQTYELTHDPLSLGWLGLVEAIPALSLVLFGGHLADRRERRAVVVAPSAPVSPCAGPPPRLSAG